MDPTGRFRRALAVDGREVADCWWSQDTTADGRMTDWLGLHGREGARITLTDTETDEPVRV